MMPNLAVRILRQELQELKKPTQILRKLQIRMDESKEAYDEQVEREAGTAIKIQELEEAIALLEARGGGQP